MNKKEMDKEKKTNLIIAIVVIFFIILFVWYGISLNNIYSDMPSKSVCTYCEFRSPMSGSQYCEVCFDRIWEYASKK